MSDPGGLTFQDIREALADLVLEKASLAKQVRSALARIAELEQQAGAPPDKADAPAGAQEE
jgi:phage shock protein A